jgi:teichuronic acid exporter
MFRQKVMRATLWSGMDVLLRQVLQLAISVVLARHLAPDVFGTLAALYLFGGVASIVADGGLAGALVQSQHITRTDESTVFWFNAVVGFVVSLLLWLAAPAIAGFYHATLLEPLTRVYAASLWINFLGAVPGALMTKRLDFRSQLLVGAVSMGVSGAVVIVMAIVGYGVWALAVQTVLSSVLTTVFSWITQRWYPLFAFSRESAQRLFRFGGFVLLSGVLEAIYSKIYTVIIGRFYTVVELAFYSRADTTKQLPITATTGMLARVTLPVFSAAAGNPARLRNGLQLALRLMMLVNTPMMLGLLVVARHALIGVYGAQWAASTTLLQILCLDGLFWPFHLLNLNVLLAQGHSGHFFRLALIKQGIGITLLVLGALHSVEAMAWAQVMYSCLAFGINAYYTERLLQYGLLQQWKDWMPVLLVSSLMALIVAAADRMFTASPIMEFFLYILLGAVVYVGGLIVFKVRAFNDLKGLLLPLLKRGEPAEGGLQ